MSRVGRNEPCWCGSGEKYKKCHLRSDEEAAAQEREEAADDAEESLLSFYGPEELAELAEIYDADVAPEPEEWLSMDEAERMVFVGAYHEHFQPHEPARISRLHNAVHAVVETQLAEGDEAVSSALERLVGTGMGRHDAVHAIGEVLGEWMQRAVVDAAGEAVEYTEALAALGVPE